MKIVKLLNFKFLSIFIIIINFSQKNYALLMRNSAQTNKTSSNYKIKINQEIIEPEMISNSNKYYGLNINNNNTINDVENLNYNGKVYENYEQIKDFKKSYNNLNIDFDNNENYHDMYPIFDREQILPQSISINNREILINDTPIKSIIFLNLRSSYLSLFSRC